MTQHLDAYQKTKAATRLSGYGDCANFVGISIFKEDQEAEVQSKQKQCEVVYWSEEVIED